MSKILSCPLPQILNPLSPNGFMFKISKLPDLTYWCQRITLPALTLPVATQATPFVQIGQTGDTLDYADLTVEFLVDSQMSNYIAVHNWLTNGFPGQTPANGTFSDATLHVLGAQNETVRTIRFADVTPTSLEGLTFESTASDVQYLGGSITFRYTYYEFD